MWQCKSIFLNLTNRCNVRCKKCITLRVIRKSGELSKEMLFAIMHLLETNEFCGLIRCGLGENLIYTHLDDLIEYLSANTKKFKFDLLTNGLAFPVDKEIYYTNNSIRWGVTLDGMEQDDIEGLQYGLDVEIVKKKLYQIKKKYPSCKMYLNYTLHNKNLHHLYDFVRMAIDLGIQQIFVTPLKVFENHFTDFLSKYIPNLSLPSNIDIFSKVKHLANKNGVKIFLPENSTSTLSCAISNKYSPIIDIDGMVSFCSGQENVKIGKITNLDIVSNWNKFKNKTKDKGKISNFCTNCLNLKNNKKTILKMPFA